MAVLVGRTTTGPGSPSTWSLWSPPARGGRVPTAALAQIARPGQAPECRNRGAGGAD